MVRLVAIGTGHIDDDAGVVVPVGSPLAWAGHVAELDAGRAGLEVVFVGDGGEGAEEEIADVGEDGGAACGDAVLRKQAEEIGEDLVEVGGGLEFSELAEEGDGEVGFLEAAGAGVDVFGAETGGDVGDGMAAAASGAGAVLATGQVIGGAGVDGWFVHQLNGGTGVDGLFVHGDPQF
jgi:hypothetical protein